MFAKFLVVPLFIATSVVARPAIARRAGDVSLADWPSQNLESYWSFKMRYTHLGCSEVPGTDFYTTCCYPLGASESISDRPAECKPATCSAPPTSSTPTIQAESSADEDDDSDLPYCQEGESEYEEDEYTAESIPSIDYTPPVYTPPAVDSPAPSQDQPTENTPAPSPSPDNGGNTGNVNYGGFATYFYQNGNAGACGQPHRDDELIVAIDQRRYGFDYSHPSDLCGKWVHIKNPANGNTVEAMIADSCPTCDNENSIDLSEGTFKRLADLSVGHMEIEWYFL